MTFRKTEAKYFSWPVWTSAILFGFTQIDLPVGQIIHPPFWQTGDGEEKDPALWIRATIIWHWLSYRA